MANREEKIIGFNDELKPGTKEDLETQFKDFQKRMQEKTMNEEAAKQLTDKLNRVKE